MATNRGKSQNAKSTAKRKTRNAQQLTRARLTTIEQQLVPELRQLVATANRLNEWLELQQPIEALQQSLGSRVERVAAILALPKSAANTTAESDHLRQLELMLQMLGDALEPLRRYCADPIERMDKEFDEWLENENQQRDLRAAAGWGSEQELVESHDNASFDLSSERIDNATADCLRQLYKLLRAATDASDEVRPRAIPKEFITALSKAAAMIEEEVKSLSDDVPAPAGAPGRRVETADIAEYANQRRKEEMSWSEIADQFMREHPDDERVAESSNPSEYMRSCHRRHYPG